MMDKKVQIRVIGILMIILSFFLALSFFSYLTNVLQKPVENLGGEIGYFASRYSIHFLGKIFPFFITLILFVTGIYLILKIPDKSDARKLLFFLLFLLFMSSLFHYFFEVLSLNRDVFTLFNSLMKKYTGKYFPPIIYVFMALLFIYFLFPEFSIKLPTIKLTDKIKRSKRSVEKKREKKEKKEEKKEKGKGVFSKIKEKAYRQKEIPEVTYPDIDDFIEELISEKGGDGVDKKELEENARMIEEKLKEFNIYGKVVSVSPGPFVTRYDYEPAPGIKISKILSLADDLALRMKSHKIRVVAPLPGKGLVGIEIPNKKQRIVYVKNFLDKKEYRSSESKLIFPLGVTTGGEPFFADLRKMPHFLIAGATGSGKTVCINVMLASLLLRNKPHETKFLLIDPKRVELSFYEGIPHLLKPVVKDRKEAMRILSLAVYWMEERYRHLAKDGVRDIESHNKNLKRLGCSSMPYIVIVIDEFADLMLATGSQVEMPLARLAQMARAVGIHLVVATQRPSVDVITGTIKANFPVRVAFKVPSKVDSRTILDQMGAEKLLGRGDMLFIPPGSSELMRLHGPYITEEEIKKVTNRIITNYLHSKIEQIFGPGDYNPWINKILNYGLIPTITGAEKTAFEEKIELAIDYFFDYFPEKEKEKEQIVKKLIELSKNYYPVLPELDWEVPEVKVKIEGDAGEGEHDPLLVEAAKLVVSTKQASATYLQRKLRLGFARAARIIDQLEELGIIGHPEGSKPRKVLKTEDELMEVFKKRG